MTQTNPQAGQTQKEKAREMDARAVKNHADIAAMSFEKAMEELEHIVTSLERGDVELEQSIRIYERGEALKTHCATLLSAAEDRVEKIRLAKQGTIEGVEPLDPSS